MNNKNTLYNVVDYLNDVLYDLSRAQLYMTKCMGIEEMDSIRNAIANLNRETIVIRDAIRQHLNEGS